MRTNYLLDSAEAKEIYGGIKALPICDYHCHLSPKEIYEDKAFDNIGQMWLEGDHYKWRFMRQAGIPEEFITGNAPWREKFRKYASVIAMAGGNPLFAWSMMELSMYFGIDTPLNESTADAVFDAAGAHGLSPRALIKASGVAYIATTDSPSDSLEYHALLKADKSFATVVAPTFRPDDLFKIEAAGFAEQVQKLGEAAGVIIDDIGDLRIALRLRLDAFQDAGCRFSDLGIEFFPEKLCLQAQAAPVFKKALAGNALTAEECALYMGYLYRFLAREYKRRGLTMQLHLAVKRDANTKLTAACGRDTGSDCVGNAIAGNTIIRVLDSLNNEDSLPKTIVYTLNPGMNAQLGPICGTFPGVVQGAAWWYCDHKRGILDVMESIAETGYFGTFMGMLTDSRSFLSYARHDYFRRILSSLLARWVIEDDFSMDSAKKLAADISYYNTKNRALPEDGDRI